jgi:hypothetical protein
MWLSAWNTSVSTGRIFYEILFIYFFKVCKSVHHRTVQINHQPDATIFQFIILTFIYSSTVSGVSPPIIRSSMTAVASSGFIFVSWSGRPARPRTQHDCHQDTKVKPEAATAVIEFLMMGGETPETC